MTKEFERCPICGKAIESHYMENHHYIPESKGGTVQDTMRICGTCHDVVHLYIPLDEIEFYQTPEALANHPLIAMYVNWIVDKNHTGHWSVRKTLEVMVS
jgi:hypothetical protein